MMLQLLVLLGWTKKALTALLDFIRENVPNNRERSIGITNYEQAAMWAVKANFT